MTVALAMGALVASTIFPVAVTRSAAKAGNAKTKTVIRGHNFRMAISYAIPFVRFR